MFVILQKSTGNYIVKLKPKDTPPGTGQVAMGSFLFARDAAIAVAKYLDYDIPVVGDAHTQKVEFGLKKKRIDKKRDR